MDAEQITAILRRPDLQLHPLLHLDAGQAGRRGRRTALTRSMYLIGSESTVTPDSDAEPGGPDYAG
jgi:hypothetical protein